MISPTIPATSTLPNTFPTYLEIGQKRTFAGAVDWPGWCRSGRDEGSALQALAVYGRCYAGVLRTSGLEFSPPADVAALLVVERLPGNATTDFGAPDAVLTGDALPMAAAELERLQAILAASWQALNAALHEAAGKELRKGPRGGGRDLDAIARHVLDANASYLGRLAWKAPIGQADSMGEEMARAREATALALDAAGRGLTPTQGPRGGVLWAARTFARRAAWHLLDHAWEIEDRSA
ncbi:MAG: hypothetical protein K1X65_05035 [Caldilineales bacterium]|nr:hypothetical protein [Caldilineales bacterium]MCW5856852.1 hypothetical protein [Caldilineales bacterium]